jgi:hypothetical protein
MTIEEQVTKIQRFLNTIFTEGDLIEVRGLGSPDKGTLRVLTNDFNLAARSAVKMSDWAGADIYFALNPIALESRYAQRETINYPYARVAVTAGDRDIANRNLYLIDIDPVRPSGTAATEEQRAAAMSSATTVRAALTERGWPQPIVIDSGNGVHLLYKGDRCSPASDVLQVALKFLNTTFGTATIKVDIGMFNPSRISRMPWALNNKAGRMASVIESPEVFEELPAWKIHTLAVEGGLKFDYDRPRPASSREFLLDEDGVRALCDEYPDHLQIDRVTHKEDAIHFGLASCPFKGGQHRGQSVGTGKTVLILRPDSIGFKCFSDDCAGHSFIDLLRHLHKETGRWAQTPIWEEDDWEELEERWGGVEDVSQRDAEPEEEEEEEEEMVTTLMLKDGDRTMEVLAENLVAVFKHTVLQADRTVAGASASGQATFRSRVDKMILVCDYSAMVDALGFNTLFNIGHKILASAEPLVFFNGSVATSLGFDCFLASVTVAKDLGCVTVGQLATFYEATRIAA